MAVVGLAACVPWANGAAQDEAFTADRHLARGVECNQCHGEGEKIPVTKEQCLSCHVSYAVVAKRTKSLEPNPHDSHQGEIECNQCHKGHKADENFCKSCHKDGTFTGTE
jgi:fumarate reductase flavoprotein subunit